MSTNRYAPGAITILGLLSGTLLAQNAPLVGPNVNMVSGVSLADGDPFLTKQNEPSLAVSSVNPMHLLAGSNDYRLIPLSHSLEVPQEGSAGADSWVSLLKSIDGGRSWSSAVLSGCPLNIPQCNDPKSAALKGREYASDPVVRPGPYGTFFYSFIAGIRGTAIGSVVGVQRFIDFNNNVKFSDDPIRPDILKIVDTGNAQRFLDKSWNVVDVPGRKWNLDPGCALPNYSSLVPAFSVYVAYTSFRSLDPANPLADIYVSSSADCGKTFDGGKRVNKDIPTNQGAVLTIDPVTGTVYVFWRQISTAANHSPDAIYVSRSSEGGRTWSDPVRVALITPFEQDTAGGRFRSEGFPTAAVSVDSTGRSRVHVAWSQRGVGPGGAARIVMTTSSNGGFAWPAPSPVDNNFQNQTVPYAGGPTAPAWSAFNSWNSAGYGHQLQPAMTFAAGKLTMIWVDQRLDHTIGKLDCSQAPPIHQITQCTEVRTQRQSNSHATDGLTTVFTQNIDDTTPSLLFRHTLDVFGGQALPADTPSFATTRVSRYQMGSPSDSAPGLVRTAKPIQQLRFNVPNVPIFVNGTKPFMGDYIDVAAQQIIPSSTRSQTSYVWNVSSSNKTVFHAAFTTNQDIVPPKDGNWAAFTPVKLLSADGTTLLPNASCAAGQEGMQNQNVYTAPIFDGIYAYSLVNSKYLNNVTPRQFNVVVLNGSSQTVTVSITIASQPTGGSAGFKISGNAITVPLAPLVVNILPSSSIARSVWVKSSIPGATVTVNVNRTDGPSPGPVASVVLNPDPSLTAATGTPAPVGGDITNNNQSDVSVKNTSLSNNDLSNNDLSNNDLSNNDLSNNDLSNNDLSNNDLSNNDLSNAGLVDSTFTLFNNGSTDVALNTKALMRGQTIPAGYKVQLIVHKTYTTQVAACGTATGYAKVQQNTPVLNIPNPKITPTSDLSDPNLKDSWVTDPDVSNATVSLMPQEIARVTFRLIKNGQTLSQNQNAAFELGSNGVKTVAVNPAPTIVPIPVVISTLQLPDATAGQSYSTALQASGGLAPLSWSQFGGNLPPGFNPLSSSGLISGTGTQPGIYSFTVQVADSSTPHIQTDKQLLTLLVHGIQSITAPPGQLVFGAPVALSANSSAGLPVTYSFSSGACTVLGNVVTATAGIGTCVVNAIQPGDQIYFPLSTSFTFTLTKATPTVTATGGTFTYDGNPHPATGSVTGVGGANLGTPAFLYTPPGDATVPVNAGSYQAAASFAGNTNYSTASAAPVTITIIKATPVIAWPPPADIVYGTALGAAQLNATTTIPGTLTYTPAAGTVLNAGNGQTLHVNFTPADVVNYNNAGKDVSISVLMAPLTIAANNQARLYAAANPLLDAAYSGFIGSDTPASLSGTLVCGTTATAGSPASPPAYPITCSGQSSANYSIVYAPGALTINRIPLAVATLPASKVYGDPLPAFAASYSGFVPGDGPGVLTGSLLFVTPASATSPVAGSPYAVTPAGLTAANYAITFVPGSLTVTKATPVFSNLSALTISAGTASTPLGGTIGYTPAVGGAPVFPSGSVLVRLREVTQPATIDTAGAFSSAFASGSLAPGTYPVVYRYTSGDSNFNPAADAAGTLTVGPPQGK